MIAFCNLFDCFRSCEPGPRFTSGIGPARPATVFTAVEAGAHCRPHSPLGKLIKKTNAKAALASVVSNGNTSLKIVIASN